MALAVENKEQLARLKAITGRSGKSSNGSKMRNVRTKGFHSKREYERWKMLKAMEDCGQIKALVKQQPLAICVVNPKGESVRCAEYMADFSYIENGLEVFEDVKPKFKNPTAEKKYKAGAQYRLFDLKRKLVEAIYGIKIKEV